MYKHYISNNIPYPSHSHDTRSRTDATLAFQRLSQCQRSLTYNGPKIWNSIPINIKNSPSISIFKNRFKHHLLENLENVGMVWFVVGVSIIFWLMLYSVITIYSFFFIYLWASFLTELSFSITRYIFHFTRFDGDYYFFFLYYNVWL